MEPQVGVTFIPVNEDSDAVLKAEDKKNREKEKEKEKEKEHNNSVAASNANGANNNGNGNSNGNVSKSDSGFLTSKCWNVKKRNIIIIIANSTSKTA